MSEQSKPEILNAAARKKLDEEGIEAVKEAIIHILQRKIDARGGIEWDSFAVREDDMEYFVDLEIVAEWLDYCNSKGVAHWRRKRFEETNDRSLG